MRKIIPSNISLWTMISLVQITFLSLLKSVRGRKQAEKSSTDKGNTNEK